MSDSREHIALVDGILQYVHGQCPNKALFVFNDKPGTHRDDKPPRLGGFIPDVYAADAPRTTTIVGEAKTPTDLETTHSYNQLRAFVTHLKCHEDALLILATRWTAMAVARAILMRVCIETNGIGVRLVLVDESAVAHVVSPGKRY